jgi:vacuolar-type H+-ATPase subunit F/Vma7
MRIAVIGSRTMTMAFRLGGVEDVTEVHDDGAVDAGLTRTRFKELTGDAEVGMIVISENAAGAIRKDIDRFHDQKRMLPLLLELPDTGGETEDRMALVIRRAVGIDVTR